MNKFQHKSSSRQPLQVLAAQVVSGIESTPNPSSFLIQLSEPLSGLEDLVGSLQGRSYSKRVSTSSTTTSTTSSTTTSTTFVQPPPTEIYNILQMDGIDSIYAMASALTINKKGSAKWDVILPLVLEAIDSTGQENHKELLKGLPTTSSPSSSSSNTSGTTTTDNASAVASSGQVRIRLQISNSMPIQIEGIGFLGTKTRQKLGPKFAQNMELLVNGGADFFAGRKWIDRGTRYMDYEGDNALRNSNDSNEIEQEKFELMTVLQAEVDEYDAAYSEERLATIVAKQQQLDEDNVTDDDHLSSTPVSQMDLERVQYHCDLAEEGSVEALTILSNFVKSHEGKMAARRNALAYLGGTGGSSATASDGNITKDLVFAAVVSAWQQEPNPIMRRTAGDALSDLGDSRAIPYALEGLTDRSKLVQWRAARIVGELGDSMETAAVLKEASFSSEYAFEVAFEIKDAMRKVRERALNKNDAGGSSGTGPGTGPMWKQIQDGMAEKNPKSE